LVTLALSSSCHRCGASTDLQLLACRATGERQRPDANIDQNLTIAAKYDIISVPTMNVYQSGKVVKTIVGTKRKAAIDRDDLADFIAR
jgi:thioredoxin-like negative regulator of GroEL